MNGSARRLIETPTVREAARLQSFYNGFVFKSSEWQQLNQIGNAVPPLLAHALGHMATAVLENVRVRRAGERYRVPASDLFEHAAAVVRSAFGWKADIGSFISAKGGPRFCYTRLLHWTPSTPSITY